MRKAVVLAIVAVLTLAAGPAKRDATVAPPQFPHPIALFLDDLSGGGTRQVTFSARAVGVRFFFEEPTGVTVYRFNRGRYVKEEFLPGSTIAKAMKKYQQ